MKSRQALIGQAYDKAVEKKVTDGSIRLLTWMILHAVEGVEGPTYFAGRDMLAWAMGRDVEGMRDKDRIAAYQSVKRQMRVLKHAGLVTVVRPSVPGDVTAYVIHV